MSKKRVKFLPMPGKIAVQTDEDEENLLRRGGLFLLSDPKSSRIGRVVAIYEPFMLDSDQESSPYVGLGDMVVFGKHTGTEVTVENDKVIILREAEILTKISFEEVEVAQES